MRILLSYGGATLITSALLDPLIAWGKGIPLPWIRDSLLLTGGITCLYLLVRFRKSL